MSRKILILVLSLNPFLFVMFFGYPIKKTSILNQRKDYQTSRRCFKVGELKQMIDCYAKNERLEGLILLKEVRQKNNLLFGETTGDLFCILLGGLIVATIMIII